MKRSIIDFVEIKIGSRGWQTAPLGKARSCLGPRERDSLQEWLRMLAKGQAACVRVFADGQYGDVWLGLWRWNAVGQWMLWTRGTNRTKGTKGFAWTGANGWLGLRALWRGSSPGMPALAPSFDRACGTLQIGGETLVGGGQMERSASLCIGLHRPASLFSGVFFLAVSGGDGPLPEGWEVWGQ
ncbi:MAG: hypothetical protein JWR26_2281 [Pedosphaera sp.]|nr:hypothetical protein [Pedosphaera sp.]